MALAIRGTDFAPGTAEADIRFARELGLLASFHVACAKHGPRPQSMQSLAEQRLLGEDVNLVHANFLTADEFRVIANNGASVSITPEVEMQMGLGLPPTGAVLAARAKFNIGTDVVTGVSTDMFTQMRFLIQTQRALTNDTFHKRETMPDRLAITVRQALELATIKSAQCFGLDGRIGSLTPGKRGRRGSAAQKRYQHAGGCRSDLGHRAARRCRQRRHRHCGRQRRQTEREAHLPRPAATSRRA